MHKMVVLAKAVEGKTEELARWYDEQHMPDLLAVSGLISAERHDLITLKRPDSAPAWDFMLIYELAGDPMGVIKNMAEAQIVISDLLESTSTISVVALSKGVTKES